MKSEFCDYHENISLETIHNNHHETIVYHEEEKKDLHMVEIVNRVGTFRGFGETEEKATKNAINNYIERIGKQEGMTA
jgi:hypothetical protein